jgi:hypothetical protein
MLPALCTMLHAVGLVCQPRSTSATASVTDKHSCLGKHMAHPGLCHSKQQLSASAKHIQNHTALVCKPEGFGTLEHPYKLMTSHCRLLSQRLAAVVAAAMLPERLPGSGHIPARVPPLS